MYRVCRQGLKSVSYTHLDEYKRQVKPDVKLGKYKGLKVKKIEYAVTDEDIDAEINNMKEKAARFVDITDQPVEDGNVAMIDFEGSVDGVPFEGGSAKNHNLTIGSGQFIPGFEEQIIGKNIGDEFDVNVTFPEDYQAEELKGKPAVFKVKVNAIKKKEYPELDDEFAKDVSEFDTFEQLKEETKKHLQQDVYKRQCQCCSHHGYSPLMRRSTSVLLPAWKTADSD